MKPQRVQLSRAAGWRMPPDTIKVDRSTRWGNPFVVGKHGTREQCVRLFRRLVGGEFCSAKGVPHQQLEVYLHVTSHKELLRGKNLACWCPLDKPCHADVLLEIANSTGVNEHGNTDRNQA